MSKVYTEQVQKAEALSAGMKKNYERIKNKGIRPEAIDELHTKALELEAMSREIDKIKAETSNKVRIAQEKLAELKNDMLQIKQIIKPAFSQEQWIDFGIADKR